MIGPFMAVKPEDKIALMAIATQLSCHGERIYVVEVVEAPDEDFPMLNGIAWWHFSNTHDSCQRYVEDGMANGAYTGGTLIGMADCGDWFNQEQVIRRRAGIAQIAKQISKEFKQ